MVGRHAVRAQQDKVFDGGKVVLDASKYLIGKFDFPCGWHFETKDPRLALAFSLLYLGRRKTAASAIIFPGHLCLSRSLTLGRQRLHRTKAWIGSARFLQL